MNKNFKISLIGIGFSSIFLTVSGQALSAQNTLNQNRSSQDLTNQNMASQNMSNHSKSNQKPKQETTKVSDWAVPLQTATDLESLANLKYNCNNSGDNSGRNSGNVSVKVKVDPIPHNNGFNKKYTYKKCQIGGGHTVSGIVVFNHQKQSANKPINNQKRIIKKLNIHFLNQNVHYKGKHVAVKNHHLIIKHNHPLIQIWPLTNKQKINHRLNAFNTMSSNQNSRKHFEKLSKSIITSANLYYKNKKLNYNKKYPQQHSINGFIKMSHYNVNYILDMDQVSYDTNHNLNIGSYHGSLSYMRDIQSNKKSGQVYLNGKQYIANNGVNHNFKPNLLKQFDYSNLKEHQKKSNKLSNNGDSGLSNQSDIQNQSDINNQSSISNKKNNNERINNQTSQENKQAINKNSKKKVNQKQTAIVQPHHKQFNNDQNKKQQKKQSKQNHGKQLKNKQKQKLKNKKVKYHTVTNLKTCYSNVSNLRLYVARQHNYIAKQTREHLCQNGKAHNKNQHFVPGKTYYQYYLFPKQPAFYPLNSVQKYEAKMLKEIQQNGEINHDYQSNGITDGYGSWSSQNK